MANPSLPQSVETPQTYTIKEFQLLVRDKPAVPGETGIRKGEALALKWSNIKMSQQILTVGRSKNRKVRDVPLYDFAIGWLGKLVRYIDCSCVFVNTSTSRP